MTDYLRKYAPGVRKFQMGGEMAPAEPGMEAAPAEQGMGGEPDLQAMLMEFAQSQDPQLAVQICNLLLEMMQGQGAEGGAPGAPGAEAMPMAARGMAIKTPVFRKGGKLLPRY
jgi:hypothetical protein